MVSNLSSPNQGKFFMKNRIVLTLAMGLAFLFTGVQNDAEAATDAVSAASLVVTITKVTSTEVNVDYSFDERAGTRNFCYAIAPATPSNTCVTQTPRSLTGSLVAKNLTPASQYNYALSAVDPSGRHKTSTTRGTFTTLKAAVVSIDVKAEKDKPSMRRAFIPGTSYSRDLLGRQPRSNPEAFRP
jgi:Flp pilus assembly protein TadG